MLALNVDELHRVGSQLMRDGRLIEAEAVYRHVIRLAPEDPRIRMAMAVVLLSRGNYGEAWPYYAARFDVPGAHPKPAVPWPEWRGEPLRGKRLVVFPEQGLGDQLMFARFALEQQQAGAEVTVLCSEPLVTLFRNVGLQAIAAEGSVEFPDPDYWTTSNSLAGWSGVDVTTLSGAPYLTARARSVGGRIGVAVRGNPGHLNDANRSITGAAAERLLSIPGAVSLAPEDTGARDFADTAEIVAGLELVVSVDTSVAHLAGALGKPTSVLLPAIMPDWRWGAASETTPWYRTLRLYRQAGAGWDAVIDRLLADLN
jgi:hypothetical protein